MSTKRKRNSLDATIEELASSPTSSTATATVASVTSSPHSNWKRNRSLENSPYSSGDPFAALGRGLEFGRYLTQNLQTLVKDFSDWPLEDLRIMTRTSLKEMTETLFIIRRKKEAQLVLKQYYTTAPSIFSLKLNESANNYSNSLNAQQKKTLFDKHSKKCAYFLAFLSGLSINHFHDKREIDYPLNTRRMQTLSDKEKGHSKHEFKHRVLFEGSKRELVLSFHNQVAFSIKCHDLEPEEIIRLLQTNKQQNKEDLNQSFTHVVVSMHTKVSPQEASTNPPSSSTTTNKERMIMYYFNPYDATPMEYSGDMNEAIGNFMKLIVGSSIYHPDGLDEKLATSDILSILLDISELLVVDRGEYSHRCVSKMRHIAGLSKKIPTTVIPLSVTNLDQDLIIIEPTTTSQKKKSVKFGDDASQQLPASPQKTNLIPKITNLPSFISQETLNYVKEQKYLYETGKV